LENGNILAEFEDDDEKNLLGSKEGLDKMSDKLTNRNMFNQIEQFNSLVAPLYKHMDGKRIQEKVKRIKNPPAQHSKDWHKREVSRKKKEIMEHVEEKPPPKKIVKPKRQHHKRQAKVRTSAVPWALLDELDKEKIQLQKDMKAKRHLLEKE